jgi:hypothetical protein
MLMTLKTARVLACDLTSCEAPALGPRKRFVDVGTDQTAVEARKAARVLGWGRSKGRDLCPCCVERAAREVVA